MTTLSPAEQLVADCLPDGLSNKGIARRVGIGFRTVEIHVAAIIKKLGVRNRTQAALYIDRQRGDR